MGLVRELTRANRATAILFPAAGLRTSSDSTPSLGDSKEVDGDVANVMQWLAEQTVETTGAYKRGTEGDV